MILPFSQFWPKRMGELAGKPNFFVEKIWTGLPYNIGSDYYCFMEEYVEKTGQYWDGAWAPGIETNFHPNSTRYAMTRIIAGSRVIKYTPSLITELRIDFSLHR